jgi:hypothetical protein
MIRKNLEAIARGRRDALAGLPRQLVGLTGEEIVWYLIGYTTAIVMEARP